MIELKTIFLKELDETTESLKARVLTGALDPVSYKATCEGIELVRDIRDAFNKVYDKLYRNDEDLDYEDETT